jgi:DNA-binding Lrp family transcriptional regulator
MTETNELKALKVDGIELGLVDSQIVLETQKGIPIVSRPYLALSHKLNISEDEIISKLYKLKEAGFIRKVAGTPNHYKIGYTANAMTVWDVTDEHLDSVGFEFRKLGFVSHCYVRPRALPVWPYSLFAMVHGRSKEEVELKIIELKEKISGKFNSMDSLYSTKILKKTGIRF